MKDDTKTVTVNDTGGGVKLRVSWGTIERALKQNGILNKSDYIKGIKADEHGVSLTLGNHKG